jgi:hypothetical protein
MSYGEDIMKSFFGDDLGFTSESTTRSPTPCSSVITNADVVVVWNHLGLGKPANE